MRHHMIAEEFAVNNETRFLTRFQELKERWQVLVDTLPDHVILLGVEGKIQIINQAIPGFTIQQVVGTLICDYIPVSQQVILRNAMKNAAIIPNQ